MDVPFHIWDVILPIDFHIFQDCYIMLYKTTNQIPYRLLFYNNECYYLTIISTWITTNCLYYYSYVP